MSAASTTFLFGLGVTTFAVAALCFFAYDSSAAKDRLRHRLELIAVRRWPSRPPATRAARSADAAMRLMAGSLRGDELELARRLASLHLPTSVLPRLLTGLRLVAAVILAVASLLLGYLYFKLAAAGALAGAASLGAACGWMLPHWVVGRLARRRRRAVGHGLADAIELLVISVEAGLSLEDAMHRIVAELHRSQPAMAEELALTSADLKILPSRDDALRRLAERVDLPSVRAVVTTLSQTLKYGTPLAQALRIVAAELRDNDLLKLEEQANRLPVLLTVPMIVFILPSIFLIIGGPAFLKVLDVFAHMH